MMQTNRLTRYVRTYIYDVLFTVFACVLNGILQMIRTIRNLGKSQPKKNSRTITSDKYDLTNENTVPLRLIKKKTLRSNHPQSVSHTFQTY